MTIAVRAELHVYPETRDEFAKVARALAQIAANEAGTLRYDWYISEDPTVFVVIEEYADPEAAIAHNENCVEFLDRIAELAQMTSAHLHGHLGPVLEAWVGERSFAHAYPSLD